MSEDTAREIEEFYASRDRRESNSKFLARMEKKLHNKEHRFDRRAHD